MTLKKSTWKILAKGSWPLTSTANQIIAHPNQIMAEVFMAGGGSVYAYCARAVWNIFFQPNSQLRQKQENKK